MATKKVTSFRTGERSEGGEREHIIPRSLKEKKKGGRVLLRRRAYGRFLRKGHPVSLGRGGTGQGTSGRASHIQYSDSEVMGGKGGHPRYDLLLRKWCVSKGGRRKETGVHYWGKIEKTTPEGRGCVPLFNTKSSGGGKEVGWRMKEGENPGEEGNYGAQLFQGREGGGGGHWQG